MKSKTFIKSEGACDLTILTDNKPRELVALCDLSDKEREDFDYIEGEAAHCPRLVRFRGNWYDVNEYQRCNGKALNEWDGNASDSYFSGTLVKYADKSCETVIMGRYYC